MHPTLRALLSASILLAGLLASAPAPVSAASATTRWVDDDGKVSSTSCNGTSRTASRTIQKGIDAANTADIVKVCPGTYVGRVVIKGARDGLVLRAATSTTPVLKARDEFDASTTYLVTIDGVSDVTVKGLRIRPLRASSHTYCSVSTGIRAIAATNLTITRNDIRPTGSGAFCGLYDGITASAGTVAQISHNVIRDFRNDGIDISGQSTEAIVESNTVTFAHVGLSTAGDSAIKARAGASVAVRFNTLTGPATGPGNPPQPAAGVQLDTLGDPSVVRANTITRFTSAIKVTHAERGTIRDNTMSGGQVGLNLLDADRMDVHGNTSTGATVHALYVAGGSAGASDASRTTDASVHDNDLRSNANGVNADCQGDSSPASYVVTQNAFADNVDTTSSPSEMCSGSGPA
jgi:nitrous oxidase accessory protein NosD